MAAGFLTRLWRKLTTRLGVAPILCDSCRYDHPSACRNRERPNATECDEYKSR